jgi:hypothetical protein
MTLKNTHVNRFGMVTFLACMAFTALFILGIVMVGMGPVDARAVPPVGLTPEQYVQRKEVWIKSTPEAIAHGEKTYKLNCAFFYEANGKDSFLEMFKSGVFPNGNKGTELEIFRMLSKGNAELGVLKVDHIREDERWNLVHYLRSLNPNLPSTTQSEWKQFFKEGA